MGMTLVWVTVSGLWILASNIKALYLVLIALCVPKFGCLFIRTSSFESKPAMVSDMTLVLHLWLIFSPLSCALHVSLSPTSSSYRFWDVILSDVQRSLNLEQQLDSDKASLVPIMALALRVYLDLEM